MTLSISIMAHPSRQEFIPYLKKMLGEDTPVSMDDESKGIIWNCRNAWSMYDPTKDFHVVIQDDAIICENFKERALAAIRKSYDDINPKMSMFDRVPFIYNTIAYNFYYGTRKALKLEAESGLKEGFVIANRPRWGVAICLPTILIKEMLEYFDKQSDPADDTRIGNFIKSKAMQVYFPMPSLVDHRFELKSLVGDPGEGRKAYAFIDNYEKK